MSDQAWKPMVLKVMLLGSLLIGLCRKPRRACWSPRQQLQI